MLTTVTVNVLNESVGIVNSMLSYNTVVLLEQLKVYLASKAAVTKALFQVFVIV